MRCDNGHEFRKRGSTVHYEHAGDRRVLSTELDDEYLPVLLQDWMYGPDLIRPYVYPELRRVLQHVEMKSRDE